MRTDLKRRAGAELAVGSGLAYFLAIGVGCTVETPQFDSNSQTTDAETFPLMPESDAALSEGAPDGGDVVADPDAGESGVNSNLAETGDADIGASEPAPNPMPPALPEDGRNEPSVSEPSPAPEPSAAEPDAPATCEPEHYRSLDEETCVRWTSCEPGQHVAAVGTVEQDQTCTPCQPGAFSSVPDSLECSECRWCGWLGEAATCSTTQDTVCRSEDVVDQFGATDDHDEATALAVDAAGNVWVTGWTFGILATDEWGTSNDVFLRKYSADGSAPETLQFGSDENEEPAALAVDAAGNVWIGGKTAGPLSGSPLGETDAFVWRYPVGGGVPSIYQFGTDLEDEVTALAADAAGNVWAVGDTEGSLGGEHQGNGDVFVRKYFAAGGAPETRQFGTGDWDHAGAATVDPEGNLWIAGTSSGGLSGGLGGFLRKYPADSSSPVTVPFSASVDVGAAVAIDSAGGVWVAGLSANSVWRFPADGSGPLETRVEGPNTLRGLVLTPNGGAWVTGWPAVDFAPIGVGTIALVEIRLDGQIGSRRQLGSGDNDVGASVAADRYGNLWVAGLATGTWGRPGTAAGDAFVVQVGL